MSKFKKVAKKTGKISVHVVMAILALLVLLFVFLSTRPGKNLVRTNVENYLNKVLKTKVEIGSLNYRLPEWIELNDVYVEDQRKDTLLLAKKMLVNVNLLKLAFGNTDIQKAELEQVFVNINRPAKDSTFNYQFILDAFTGNKSSTKIKDTAELKITLDHLKLKDVHLDMKDQKLGNDFSADIQQFSAYLNKFQPDRLAFGIDSLQAKGVKYTMRTYSAVRDTIINIITDSAKAESTYGLYITAKKLDVQDVIVDVVNQVNGMEYRNNVKKLYLSNTLFNLNQSIATADSLILDSSTIEFKQPRKDLRIKNVVINSEPSPPWYIGGKTVRINEASFAYNDVNSPNKGGLDFSHLNTSNINIVFDNMLYSKDSTVALVKQLSFRDAAGFRLDSMSTDFKFTNKILQANLLYARTPNSIIQDMFEIKYDSVAGMKTSPENSLVHGLFRNSIIAFNDLYQILPSLRQSFPPQRFGGKFVRINTELRGTLKQLYLPSFYLSGLSGSSISGRGTLYNLSDAKRFRYDLYINNSSLRKEDIFRFVPKENQASLKDLPSIINIVGHIVGDRNNLTADIRTNAPEFGYDGRIVLTNISDPQRLGYDLAFNQVSLSRKLILGYIPPNAQQNINLPERIIAKGKFKGSKNAFDADLNLSTSYGNAKVKGNMNNFSNPQNVNYNIDVNTPGFNLGRLIKQDSLLGNIAGHIKAVGTGFDFKTMRSNINAQLNQFDFRGYSYNNVVFNGKFNHGIIDAVGTINDPNLRMTYDFVSNVSKAYPTLEGYFDVDTANLRALKFTNDTLNLSMYADVKARNTTPRQLDVDAIISNLNFQTANEKISLDTPVVLNAFSENGIDDITLQAPFISAHANGAFDYDRVGQSIAQYINNYYTIAPKLKNQDFGTQQISLQADIKKTDLLKLFIKDLHSYERITINGNYSSDYGDSALNMKTVIPFIHYKDYIMRNGDIAVNSKNGFINYDTQFDTLFIPKMKFFGTKINGAAARDSISFNAITQDDKATDWFGANATIFKNENTTTLTLKDNLLLNYGKWKVAPNNFISYSPNGVVANNFLITSDTASIHIQSEQLVAGSPLKVDIKNFDLKNITSLIGQDTVLATGILDANFVVSDFNKRIPAFTGSASIDQLTIMNQLIGDLSSNTQKVNDNQIAATILLQDNGNDVSGNADVYLNNNQKDFDANLDIRKLNFAIIQGFAKGNVQRAGGSAHGNLNLTGKFSNPIWNGKLSFDSARFALSQLGAPYYIDGQTLILSHPSLRFDNFVVTDSLGSPMTINGRIIAKNISEYTLGLRMKANDFIIMNAKKAIDNEFYGFASIDADMTMSGTSELPIVSGDVHLNDKSDVYIVLPEANYIKDQGIGVVKFIDTDTFDIYKPPTEFVEQKPEEVKFIRFLNYNFNVDVSENSTLTIIVDPSTGDEIKVQGEAYLNAGVDPGGNLMLAGNYELNNGYYNLSYQFLKRQFQLVKGSSIMFTGSPMNAYVNITAEYKANTPSGGLLRSEVSESNTVLSNIMNEKLPFVVRLYLTGVLSKPNIQFKIELPEDATGVNSELRNTIDAKLAQINADEAAVNKQVFSLLLFGRFVGEQSSDFFKGNGDDFGDIARQSVSQFLSGALNQIAADMIKGVDIDLNLNSYRDYYGTTSSARTDLNVALSKTFLNDRLTIKVGQNFGLDGADAASKTNSTGNAFSPDIFATYKLTQDGKYMLRAYRKNQYEAVVDGFVVESGLSFIMTLDYEHFHELFKKKPKATTKETK